MDLCEASTSYLSPLVRNYRLELLAGIFRNVNGMTLNSSSFQRARYLKKKRKAAQRNFYDRFYLTIDRYKGKKIIDHHVIARTAMMVQRKVGDRVQNSVRSVSKLVRHQESWPQKGISSLLPVAHDAIGLH